VEPLLTGEKIGRPLGPGVGRFSLASANAEPRNRTAVAGHRSSGPGGESGSDQRVRDDFVIVRLRVGMSGHVISPEGRRLTAVPPSWAVAALRCPTA
jgi:hypothetical protein